MGVSEAPAGEEGHFFSESSQVAWPDPPWSISGRTLTAWFDVPRSLLEAVLPDYLLPPESTGSWARLRFYDAAFRAVGARELHPLVVREGRFREAVVAFPAACGDFLGDSTLFMWADSEAYTTWGREVFGWPVLRGAIELGGPLWEPELAAGAAGHARMSEPRGSAGISAVELGEQLEHSAPGGCWLTPRRVLHRAGLGGETVDVVAVVPRVISAGTSYAARGEVRLDFPFPHLLHTVDAADAELKVVDGFELVVGEQVHTLPPSRRAR